MDPYLALLEADRVLVRDGEGWRVREAPDRGYDTITVRTIQPGTVVVAELVNLVSGLCTFSLSGSSTYAKFVVDSVNPTARRFYVRSVGDANCGYRSLVADSIPTF